jgi:hypothetical protein
MNSTEQNYDIHEKIAQLETELLQHELLIRRQKHVINSLKQMITSPPGTPAANAATTTSTRAGAAHNHPLVVPTSRSNNTTASHNPPATQGTGRTAAVSSSSSSVIPPTAPSVVRNTTAVPVHRGLLANRGPAVRQKKRTAIAKVNASSHVITW